MHAHAVVAQMMNAKKCKSAVMSQDVDSPAKNLLSQPVQMENLSCCVYTCVNLQDVLHIQRLLASLIHVRCAKLSSMMNKEILSTALKV